MEETLNTTLDEVKIFDELKKKSSQVSDRDVTKIIKNEVNVKKRSEKLNKNIFGKLLAKVGERAAELNDPQMNNLMCRLTIYTCADPESKDYDPAKCREVARLAKLDGGNPS